MKTRTYPLDFSTCGTPNPSTLETSFSPSGTLGCPSFPTKIWGTVRDMGKFFWGSVANIFLGKVTEAFQKNSKQFWCSGEKTGLGVNYPPPLATQGLTCISFTVLNNFVVLFVFDWYPISKGSMTSWLMAQKQWRQCFGRSLVRQCHTYLLTYYPTGTG